MVKVYSQGRERTTALSIRVMRASFKMMSLMARKDN
jgi:hypothetical protein